jgi:nicotinate-nucleotide--dimethylbenzimidazole phosphoribosyltransferase
MTPHLPAFTAIPTPDTACGERVASHLDTLTKPPGSLGELEALVVTLATITGEDFPRVSPPGMLVFAADHGVAAEGVSAFPQEITAQMVANFVAGGAAINVLARRLNARLEVIDVGVASDAPLVGVVDERIRPGSGNMLHEDAMTRAQAEASLMVGRRAAERALDAGCRCLIVGEMGIGNTTAGSAVLAALDGAPLADIVGPGTGLDKGGITHKRQVIERALAARAPDSNDPLGVLTKVGGLEIGAMAGACLAAAARRVPVLVDGFIASVAALLGCRLDPALRPYLIFGHRSREPGHSHVLTALDAKPLLSLNMRLGEGTGAALAFPLLDAACAVLAEMATFADAGIQQNPQ